MKTPPGVAAAATTGTAVVAVAATVPCSSEQVSQCYPVRRCPAICMRPPICFHGIARRPQGASRPRAATIPLRIPARRLLNDFALRPLVPAPSPPRAPPSPLLKPLGADRRPPIPSAMLDTTIPLRFLALRRVEGGGSQRRGTDRPPTQTSRCVTSKCMGWRQAETPSRRTTPITPRRSQSLRVLAPRSNNDTTRRSPDRAICITKSPSDKHQHAVAADQPALNPPSTALGRLHSAP